jgi:hypothetical protein
MTEREQLHALIDALPNDKVPEALRFVEYLRRSAPPASLDDQPVAEEEDAKHGRIISHDGMHRRIFGKD